ncbi:MAG: type II secretion system F family protein [Bacilli bacterium]|nr:type II secretion system F family protein [Bacilli bacterium]
MYLIDKQSPVLTVSKSEITINKGETIENISIQATDNYDGDIGTNVQSNLSELNLETSGKHQLIYTVSDRAGNVTEKEVTVNVVDTTFNLIMFYSLIIILFTFAVYLITRLQKALKLEKRLDNFTIKPLHDTTKSTIDKFSENYKKTTSVIATYLEKSIFAKKYAKKLEKYTTVSYFHDTGMEILVGKVFVALIFLLIAIIAKIFQLQLLASYEVSLPLIVGFFLLDILYFTKYRLYRNRLENDLLSAIIIMNNAFKSGRSITQAIEIVSEELPGTIGKEFGKMSLELTYGLGIDVVFKRFADRVKIEEVNYLTASLTILNKTGGNIIEVFNSIEKSLFNKKKLKLELKSLTGASKIIIWVLFIVPFLFIVAISFINPEYFMPFITTNIGRILTIFMALYYILFIVCVRKIMKVVI